MKTSRKVLLLGVMLLFLKIPSISGRVMSMSLPARINESDIIARVHIRDVVSNKDSAGWDDIALAEVVQTFKGAPATHFIEIELTTRVSCGAARYEAGEHDIVFLKRLRNGRYITINAMYGKFQIQEDHVIGWPDHRTTVSLQTALMTLIALTTPQQWSLPIDGLSVFIQPFCPSVSATGIPEVLFFVKNVSQKHVKLSYDDPRWNVMLTDLQGTVVTSLQYSYYAEETRELILPLKSPQHLVGLDPRAMVMYHLYAEAADKEGEENSKIQGTYFISATAEKLYGTQRLTTEPVKIICQDSRN